MRANIERHCEDEGRSNLFTLIRDCFSASWRIAMTATICLFFFLNVTSAFADGKGDGYPLAKWKVKHRISTGPVISFYKNTPFMTTDTKRKIGFNLCYKSEICLGRKTNLMAGLEYMSQGLKFRGYYADSSYTYIYDGSFAYTHEIRFNELQLPLALKVSFNSEKEHAMSAYFFGGIGGRYLLSSYVVIANDSSGVAPVDQKEAITFEHQIVSNKYNAFYHGGIGFQKNFRETGRAFFMELTFKYGLARLHYTGHDNSNNLNIRNNSLTISVGLRL